MGKELVVSANRHETKVAILEDDQLVEIYFQRANEYSLAGSIHKGRVTRVLPGMQSAFVDLGLDRDTFLYVSDFFEENEEYESLPSEEKGRRGPGSERSERQERGDRPEKGERAERPEREPALAVRGAAEERSATSPSLPLPVPEEKASATPAGQAQQGERGDENERRGRRSRRRRGRGRGFPESKYANEGPAEREESQPQIAAPPLPSPNDDSFFVLPGESLAKYRHPETGELEQPSETESAGEQETETEAVSAFAPDLDAAPDAVDDEAELASAVDEDIEEAILDRVDAAEREDSVMSAAASGGERFTEEEEEDAEVTEEAEGAESEVVRLDPAGDLVEQQLMEPAEEDSETTESASEAEADAEVDSEGGEVAFSGEESQPEPSAFEEESAQPEPARIPQSLTATLREQGGRYPHRASRRMRRRRGGFESREGREGAPSRTPETQPTPKPEAREEQRAVSKPERGPTPTSVSITDLLKEGQEILVQIAKEPLGQKGARITSHIALPGRYVVYMPTVEHLGVSRKIGSDEERQRLKRILQTHRVGIPGGFIMRTAGEGKTEEELAADMSYLFNLWLDIRQKAERRTAPALIHHDLEIVQRILRDQFTDTFKAIWVDSEEVYESILRFVQRFQPNLIGRVKMYTRPVPIFDAFNITQELEKALRPKVWLKSGGYIVINQTEALVAVDVNTGKYVGKSNRLEDTIVKTNMEAVKEIVRQIRLRDLGGIIVVDFIDMDERKNRQKVMQALEEAMRADKAPNKILQFNDFGLVAITRKRVKQSLERALCSPCPYCEGGGYVKSVATVVGEILQEAGKIVSAVEGKDCMLRVNPEVAKYLKSTDNKYLEELEGILGRPVMVISDPRLHQEKFDLT